MKFAILFVLAFVGSFAQAGSSIEIQVGKAIMELKSKPSNAVVCVTQDEKAAVEILIQTTSVVSEMKAQVSNFGGQRRNISMSPAHTLDLGRNWRRFWGSDILLNIELKSQPDPKLAIGVGHFEYGVYGIRSTLTCAMRI